jgi:hypothetical protein
MREDKTGIKGQVMAHLKTPVDPCECVHGYKQK